MPDWCIGIDVFLDGFWATRSGYGVLGNGVANRIPCTTFHVSKRLYVEIELGEKVASVRHYCGNLSIYRNAYSCSKDIDG